MHDSPVTGLQAYESEAAFRHKARVRQGGPEQVSMAREYLSAAGVLDGSEDSDTVLHKASLLCINKRRQSRSLPLLTDLDFDEHLDRLVNQVVESLRSSHSETTPEQIMQTLNDELIGVTPAEREQFLVLDSWEIREKKGELHEWPDWVLEAIEIGDLVSDYCGTEVQKERKDLMEYLLGEPGNGIADGL